MIKRNKPLPNVVANVVRAEKKIVRFQNHFYNGKV
jgi:hypothetical protein